MLKSASPLAKLDTPSQGIASLASQGHFGIKTGKGFTDYSIDFLKAALDRAIRKRDQDFLNRLEYLYWHIRGTVGDTVT